jgi:hypothetical protein
MIPLISPLMPIASGVIFLARRGSRWCHDVLLIQCNDLGDCSWDLLDAFLKHFLLNSKSFTFCINHALTPIVSGATPWQRQEFNSAMAFWPIGSQTSSRQCLLWTYLYHLSWFSLSQCSDMFSKHLLSPVLLIESLKPFEICNGFISRRENLISLSVSCQASFSLAMAAALAYRERNLQKPCVTIHSWWQNCQQQMETASK